MSLQTHTKVDKIYNPPIQRGDIVRDTHAIINDSASTDIGNTTLSCNTFPREL